MIWQQPGPADKHLLTRRLELVPVVADDAEELTEVYGDERLYVFLASHPTTTEELRAQFDRLETLGQPPIQSWRCTFAETVPAAAPILTPRDWSLVGEAIEPRP